MRSLRHNSTRFDVRKLSDIIDSRGPDQPTLSDIDRKYGRTPGRLSQTVSKWRERADANGIATATNKKVLDVCSMLGILFNDIKEETDD